jgi:hypothetical protein
MCDKQPASLVTSISVADFAKNDIGLRILLGLADDYPYPILPNSGFLVLRVTAEA